MTKRTLFTALALFTGLSALAMRFDTHGVAWLWQPQPLIAVVLALLAVGLGAAGLRASPTKSGL